MKIIITYASAGTGHFKAAEALYDYIKEEYKEVDVRLIDVLDEANPLFRFNYTWGYSYLVTYLPWVWLWAFWITYNRWLRALTRPIAYLTDKLNTLRFSGMLRSENPDFILSTHFLPSGIAAGLKKSGKITSKLITVITDFGVHPFWIREATDAYIVASSFTKKQLLLEGVEELRIKESGIPIETKFLKYYERAGLAAGLDLDPEKFTVLLVTGSFGIGPLEEIVDLLQSDVQVLVVCARNTGLYQRLKNKNYQNVRVFGFVDNIQELMSVSDVIVTKPGGLSTAELLAKDLVPVFICAIAGQETFNIEALESYGIESQASSPQDVLRMVLDYKNNPEKLKSVKEKIIRIKKPFAAKELCDAVCKGSIGPGGQGPV